MPSHYSEQTLPLPFPPIAPVRAEPAELDFDGIDPYQEYFDYLVKEGAAPGPAWDMVWDNPARAMQIGWKLAAHRVETAYQYALAS